MGGGGYLFLGGGALGGGRGRFFLRWRLRRCEFTPKTFFSAEIPSVCIIRVVCLGTEKGVGGNPGVGSKSRGGGRRGAKSGGSLAGWGQNPWQGIPGVGKSLAGWGQNPWQGIPGVEESLAGWGQNPGGIPGGRVGCNRGDKTPVGGGGGQNPWSLARQAGACSERRRHRD